MINGEPLSRDEFTARRVERVLCKNFRIKQHSVALAYFTRSLRSSACTASFSVSFSCYDGSNMHFAKSSVSAESAQSRRGACGSF